MSIYLLTTYCVLSARYNARDNRDLIVYSLFGEKSSKQVDIYIIINCGKWFKVYEHRAPIENCKQHGGSLVRESLSEETES